MPRRGSFERRLLVALVAISLVPSLLLLAVGTVLLWQALQIHASPVAWVQLRQSGRELLDLADRTGDPALTRAAAEHRRSLDFALHQSRLWDYLDSRLLQVIPLLALALAAFLVWLAFRSARGIARELARPIDELVGWAGRVAREEPLPPRASGEEEVGDFAVLRDAMRSMAAELALSRARALEEERGRAWVGMARGVAHELKNTLTPLRLAVRALDRQTQGLPSARESLEVVAAESLRLEELARSFAQFGHLPEGPTSEIDLSELLDYLLRTHLPPGVDFRLRAPVDLPHLHGHHDALARAFANLLLNAAEAMAETGGTVTVKLSTQGDAVEVRVLDTGPGIPEENLDRIWAPDFTTKSRGTGLGLALVRQTIAAHGGAVRARNRPEGGAEFRVLLPKGRQSSVVSHQSTDDRRPTTDDRRLTTDDPMPSILIVDDEPNIRRMLGSLLRAEGYLVREAGSAREGVEAVRESEPDAALMDLVMPGTPGLDALPELLAVAPDLPVVMMSGRATLSDAVRATKLGAFHFLEKPLTPEAVLLTLRSALELRQTREVNRALRAELGEGDEMVGGSEALGRVRELVERVARSDARVLITGESGTGKELVASAIHRLSARAAGPFIRINCAAIPRDLVESELFGHEKGAFTGATERRRGRFELSDGGTLLLDEAGDLSLEAQAKLLRVLETGEFERVGGSEPIRVDVRTLSATHRDLRAEVAAGRFREDLFFRLNVIPIHLPALRERAEDVPALVAHFLARHRTRTALRPPHLTPAALDALTRHTWPGNVRELANIVERLVILHAGSEVGAREVRGLLAGSSPAAPPAGEEGSLTERLDAHEREMIRDALREAGENVAEAARRLRTDRANLYRRMRRLGLDR